MTNGKQRVREILEDLILKCEANRDSPTNTWEEYIHNEVKPQALDSIEEVVKEVIGQENEYSRDMPVPDPDPFALPSDHQNQLRRYQLGRWEGNNGQ